MARPVTVTISVRWWLKYYMYGLAAVSRMTGLEPDWRKVNSWIGRAIKTEVDR